MTVKEWRRPEKQTTLARYFDICEKTWWNWENVNPPKALWVVMRLVNSADHLPRIKEYRL